MANVDEIAAPPPQLKKRRPTAPPSVFLLGFAVCVSLILIFLVAPLLQWWAQPIPRQGAFDRRMSLDWAFQLGAMNGFTLLWCFAVGASFGSFMNVVSWRMPRGMNFVSQSSICPKCRHAIRGRDNLPVLGWILLGGSCRDCGEPISFRYPLVEICFGGAAFFLCACELASGGYNLPIANEVYRSGFFETLWTPKWDLILIVAFHFALFVWLLTLCLFEIDEEAVPRGFAIVAILFGLAVTYALPIAHPLGWFLIETAKAIPAPFAPDRFSGLIGLVIGALLAAPASLFAQNSRSFPINLILAGALVGLHLGWHAALSVIVIANVLNGLLAVISTARPPAISLIVVATTLQILAWRWLHYAQWQMGILGIIAWLLIASLALTIAPKFTTVQSAR